MRVQDINEAVEKLETGWQFLGHYYFLLTSPNTVAEKGLKLASGLHLPCIWRALWCLKPYQHYSHIISLFNSHSPSSGNRRNGSFCEEPGLGSSTREFLTSLKKISQDALGWRQRQLNRYKTNEFIMYVCIASPIFQSFFSNYAHQQPSDVAPNYHMLWKSLLFISCITFFPRSPIIRKHPRGIPISHLEASYRFSSQKYIFVHCQGSLLSTIHISKSFGSLQILCTDVTM